MIMTTTTDDGVEDSEIEVSVVLHKINLDLDVVD